jgi:hypothetical protein
VLFFAGPHLAEIPLGGRHLLAVECERQPEAGFIDRVTAAVLILEEESRREPRVGLDDRDASVGPDFGANPAPRLPLRVNARELSQDGDGHAGKERDLDDLLELELRHQTIRPPILP